jgi:hypothetical protein
LFATVRSRLTADAVADFLGVVYGQHVRSRSRAARKHASPTG